MPEILIIVAIARNRVIGREGKLPWHLPSDLQHFKKTTMGFPLIMGRKTFESIGAPLPGRINIILTRDRSRCFPGCLCRHSLEEAIDSCREHEKIFIIGGGEVFRAALPHTDTIIVTALQRDIEGDVRFGEIDPAQFRVSEYREYHEEEPYTIIRYERVRDGSRLKPAPPATGRV